MLKLCLIAGILALASGIPMPNQAGNNNGLLQQRLVRREETRVDLFSHLLDRLKRHLDLEYLGNAGVDKSEANRILRNLMQIRPIYEDKSNADEDNTNVATLLHLIRGV